MATDLTPNTLVNVLAPAAYAALGFDVTMTAGDVAGNTFTAVDKQILILHNTGGSSYTATVTSTADAQGRTRDITTYAIAAGVYSAIFLPSNGFVNSSGKITVTVSNTAVKVGILRLP